MFPKLRFVLIDCRPFSDHLNKAVQSKYHVHLLRLPPLVVMDASRGGRLPKSCFGSMGRPGPFELEIASGFYN